MHIQSKVTPSTVGESAVADWIDDYMTLTDGLPTSRQFRLWSALTCVAGACERRLWVETAKSKLFANMYVWLVGGPGSGKSVAIEPARNLWSATQKFKISPDNMTKASLVDAISRAERKIILGAQDIIEYHSMLIPAPELGVFMAAHDTEFLSVVNYVYDNPYNYREERRSLNKQIDISYPQITMLGGAQPGLLSNVLPEEAWTMGTMSRVLMVYGHEAAKIDLFAPKVEDTRLFESLTKRLCQIGDMVGCLKWAPDAQAEMMRWYLGGMDPIPEHSKLLYYCARRITHMLKLCMISAIAQLRTTITMADLQRARDWLLEAEQLMPDIFREMTQRSDIQVLDELHMFMWQLWVKKKDPIHVSRMNHFLLSRMPHDKVSRLIEMAERSNRVNRIAGSDLYSPRPRHEHGVE